VRRNEKNRKIGKGEMFLKQMRIKKMFIIKEIKFYILKSQKIEDE